MNNALTLNDAICFFIFYATINGVFFVAIMWVLAEIKDTIDKKGQK